MWEFHYIHWLVLKTVACAQETCSNFKRHLDWLKPLEESMVQARSPAQHTPPPYHHVSVVRLRNAESNIL